MHEKYDSRLVAGKLRRWSHYLQSYRLPTWEQIPTLGLYMDQVLTLLSRYLPFLPKKEKEEQIITTSAINNYVRMKLMPAPEKKKYSRIHIAYLIMICALKQSLTMSEIQKILPNGLTEEEVKKTYEAFVEQYTDSARIFVSMVEGMAAQLLAAEAAVHWGHDQFLPAADHQAAGSAGYALYRGGCGPAGAGMRSTSDQPIIWRKICLSSKPNGSSCAMLRQGMQIVCLITATMKYAQNISVDKQKSLMASAG